MKGERGARALWLCMVSLFCFDVTLFVLAVAVMFQ